VDTATDGRVDLVFDTWAWIEELDAGPHGAAILALHQAHDVGTPHVVLAELVYLTAHRNPGRLDDMIERVLATSTLLETTQDIALAAGRARAALAHERRGIGLVDCIVLETARAVAAPLVTGDPDLVGLEGVRSVV